jgi:hypothetical protein
VAARLFEDQNGRTRDADKAETVQSVLVTIHSTNDTGAMVAAAAPA